MFENLESTPFIHIETAYWWFSCFVCSLFPCFCSVLELFPDKAADCRPCFSLTGGGWEVWRGEDTTGRSSQMIKTAGPLLPIRKISKAGSDQKWSGECCSRPAFNAPAGLSMGRRRGSRSDVLHHGTIQMDILSSLTVLRWMGFTIMLPSGYSPFEWIGEYSISLNI